MPGIYVGTYYDPSRMELTRHGLQPLPVSFQSPSKPTAELLVVAENELGALQRIGAEGNVPEGFLFASLTAAASDQVLV